MAVESPVGSQDLLDQDEAALMIQRFVDARHHALAVQRAHELQGEDHQHHGGILRGRREVDIGLDQLHGSRTLELGQLGVRLGEHVVRVVDADKAHIARHHIVQGMQGGAGSAAVVIEARTRYAEVGGKLAGHALDLGIEGHRTAHHVVEHVGGRAVEGEIADARVGLREYAIRAAVRRVPHAGRPLVVRRLIAAALTCQCPDSTHTAISRYAMLQRRNTTSTGLNRM